MIIGGFALNGGGNDSSVVDLIRNMTCFEPLIYHQVDTEGFTGGYCLHPLLPTTHSDCFFCDRSSDLIVLMSGSLYNREELFQHFNISNPIPDPELIAKMFLREGPEFACRLNGDFTVFVLQEKRKQIYLVRDHIGVRPLAWVTEGGSIFFSSDIIGLCRAFSGGQISDSEALLGYFKFTDQRRTPFDRVKKLLPGHYLHYSGAGTEIKRYWHPEKIKIDSHLDYSRMISDLKALLWDSVRIRCDKRYTAGAHVSSGLDSGMVSALARIEYPLQEDFLGFSWSPANFTDAKVRYDERELVVRFCNMAGIRPVFSDLDSNSFPETVASFYDNRGFFSEDRTVTQAVALKTNLILSGWGGDEFISAGGRGIDMDLLRSMKFRAFLRRNRKHSLKKVLKNILVYVLFPSLGILERRVVKSFGDDGRYLDKHFRRNDRKTVRNFFFHTSRHQLHLRLLECYHLQERCECWAVNGYRKGVEYRYPLLDKRIIEFMLKVPSELLCRTGQFRPLLREMGKGILPDEIRLNESKNDPLYWAFMDDLFRGSATSSMEEVEAWEDNPDLHFVNFRILREDIQRLKENSSGLKPGVLYRGLVYLKAINDFTVDYRSKSQNSLSQAKGT